MSHTERSTCDDFASEKADDTLIDFDGPDDPYRPINWPVRRKITITIVHSLSSTLSTWASTIYNSGLGQVGSQFGVGQEVALLGLTLYLVGLSLGPLLWGPMSEAYGRKISLVVPVFSLMVFNFASGASKDLQTLFITRFFAGVFACAPLTTGGGVLADMWPSTQRGVALIGWGFCLIAGSLVAPVVGAALVVNLPETGWRWTFYLTGILCAVVLILDFLFIEESYPPVLLSWKADRIRIETQNWAVRSKSQEKAQSIKGIAQKYLIVPLEMLIDPICLSINLYAAFVYAIIFLAITSFPIEFQETRGYNEVVASTPFLAIVIGVALGAGVLLWSQKYYNIRLRQTNQQTNPEARLMPMLIGSPIFAAGFFIMGWTSSKDIPWIGFCVGAACLGFGFFTIFQAALNYIVDTYLMLAASALAANVLMRSLFAAAFPLFADYLFHNLGLDWGMTLLGFISVAMIPIPVLLYIFGKRMRAVGKRSKVSFVP